MKDDLISRKAVLDALGEPHPMDYNACSVVRLVKDIPAVDAAPVKHGGWKYSENIYDDSTWVCSICKEPWTLIDGTPQENGMKYCPNCGAKMDLEDEQ